MEFIPMNILEYRFDDEGHTQQIVVAFQTYQGNEQLNARVSLNEEYVQSINENVTLRTMNQQQIENFARRKLRDWINIERSTEEEATEE